MNENCECCVRLKNELEGLKAELAEARTELEGCITLGKDLYDAHATIDKLTAENARLRELAAFAYNRLYRLGQINDANHVADVLAATDQPKEKP